jgi:hypothetical protein
MDDPIPQPVEGTPNELPAPLDAEGFPPPDPLPADNAFAVTIEMPEFTETSATAEPVASESDALLPDEELPEPEAVEPEEVEVAPVLPGAGEEPVSCPAAKAAQPRTRPAIIHAVRTILVCIAYCIVTLHRGSLLTSQANARQTGKYKQYDRKKYLVPNCDEVDRGSDFRLQHYEDRAQCNDRRGKRRKEPQEHIDNESHEPDEEQRIRDHPQKAEVRRAIGENGVRLISVGETEELVVEALFAEVEILVRVEESWHRH